jgi:hypothetical protein
MLEAWSEHGDLATFASQTLAGKLAHLAASKKGT